MVFVSLKYFLCILLLISYTEQQVEDRGAIDSEYKKCLIFS